MPEHKMAVMNLTDKVVTDLVDELLQKYGTITPALLFKHLGLRGIYNQRSGKSYSRRAIYDYFQTHPVGSKVRPYGEAPPLVVLDWLEFPLVSNWLQDNMGQYEILDMESLHSADCIGRDLYGYPSLSCALNAKSVYLLCLDGMPVVTNVIIPGGAYTFKRMKCQLV